MFRCPCCLVSLLRRASESMVCCTLPGSGRCDVRVCDDVRVCFCTPVLLLPYNPLLPRHIRSQRPESSISDKGENLGRGSLRCGSGALCFFIGSHGLCLLPGCMSTMPYSRSASVLEHISLSVLSLSLSLSLLSVLSLSLSPSLSERAARFPTYRGPIKRGPGPLFGHAAGHAAGQRGPIKRGRALTVHATESHKVILLFPTAPRVRIRPRMDALPYGYAQLLASSSRPCISRFLAKRQGPIFCFQ